MNSTEEKTIRIRLAVMIVLILAAAAVFMTRLIEWQVIGSDHYDNIALSANSYTVSADAVRGEIFDRNGVELAVNKTAYRIIINKLYLPDEKLNETIVKLIGIMDRCGEKWIDDFPILMDDNGEYRFDETRSDEIEDLKSKDNLNMNPYSTADDCMSRLIERYDCRDFNKKQQRDIISVRYRMSKTAYSKTQPYIFAQDISAKTMAAVSENTSSIPGVTTESSPLRTYVNGTCAPHIVGTTGLISSEEYSKLKSKGYGYTDRLGKNGVESAFESYLRGSSGSRTYEVDGEGNASLVSYEQAKPGNSVYLTLDSRIQKTAQKALEEAVKSANRYAEETGDKNMGSDCTGAALVVLDVRDFSVLCAANYPSYNLSEYNEKYTQLAADKNQPLFDRAFMGALAPGSIYKPLTACAALEEKKITVKTSFDCQGVFTKGGLKLWCMGYHGNQDMYQAMENSCNVYFAEVGRILGIDALNKYAKRCGLGTSTGVEISESRGTLAGPEFSRMMGTEWYESFVSPAAIGQSDNQFTPLQLAAYTATIANGGVRLRTHVVDKVVSYTTGETVYESQPDVMDNMGVSQKNLKDVQKAMKQAADSYEALADIGIEVAAKTGTAENSGSDHANFICYAPFDKPEIAVAVMVEHGAKSSFAINAAKKVINAYFDGRKTDES